MNLPSDWYTHDLVWLAAYALQRFEAEMELFPPPRFEAMPLKRVDVVKASRIAGSLPLELTSDSRGEEIHNERNGDRYYLNDAAIEVVAQAFQLGLLDGIDHAQIHTGWSYAAPDPEDAASRAREMDIYRYLYALAGVTEDEVRAAVAALPKPIQPDPNVLEHLMALFPRETTSKLLAARRYRLAQAFTQIRLVGGS